MGRKTAMPWDGSFALWWGRGGRWRRDRSHPCWSGGEPTPFWPPIWVLLLSLGLWALIWGGVSLLGAYGLR
jgi:hypothetical protein